jgi:hypothetical protein
MNESSNNYSLLVVFNSTMSVVSEDPRVLVLNEKTGEWMEIDNLLQCRRCGIATNNPAVEGDMRFCDRCCFACSHQSKKILRKVPWPIQMPWVEQGSTNQISICKTCWRKSHFSKTEGTTLHGRIIEAVQPIQYDTNKGLYYVEDSQ